MFFRLISGSLVTLIFRRDLFNTGSTHSRTDWRFGRSVPATSFSVRAAASRVAAVSRMRLRLTANSCPLRRGCRRSAVPGSTNNSATGTSSAFATRTIVLSRKSLRPVSRCPMKVRSTPQKSANFSWDLKPRSMRSSRMRRPRRFTTCSTARVFLNGYGIVYGLNSPQ